MIVWIIVFSLWVQGRANDVIFPHIAYETETMCQEDLKFLKEKGQNDLHCIPIPVAKKVSK